MFGIGWALVGFCPGPAIAALTVVDGNVFMFFIAMSIGMLLKENFKFDLFALKELSAISISASLFFLK